MAKTPSEHTIGELLTQLMLNMQLCNEVCLLALIFLERLIVRI